MPVNKILTLLKQSTIMVMISSLLCQQVAYAAAAVEQISTMSPTITTGGGNITVDGSTNTGMDRAQNNVPILNISAPGSTGVSKNNFTDYHTYYFMF